MRMLLLVLATLLGCARDDRSAPSTPPKPMMQPVPGNLETALLAGGCFWGMEDLLRKIPGVVDTETGYVAKAEAVRVVFDPSKVSYATLLDDHYFRMHDPTTKNRQGNDVGVQYRSAIFYLSEAQRATAEQSKQKAGASGRWKNPIVTEIVAATDFERAEDYHQDYLERNRGGYTCHFMRE